MFTKTLIAAALVAAVAAPAQALISPNALTDNGRYGNALGQNALNDNGRYGNALNDNGLGTNGKYGNGRYGNGTRINGVETGPRTDRVRVIAIELFPEPPQAGRDIDPPDPD